MSSTPADRPAILLEIARDLAAAHPNFQVVLGPGKGDHANASFMRQLRERAIAAFGKDYSEQGICGKNNFKVDFFFPKEATIVEVALGLPNPSCEFEKDILKAIMAQDVGRRVRRLFFISRAGGVRKCAQPGRTAFIAWARTKHRLAIEVHDLGGAPRRRQRRPRVRR